MSLNAFLWITASACFLFAICTYISLFVAVAGQDSYTLSHRRFSFICGIGFLAVCVLSGVGCYTAIVNTDNVEVSRVEVDIDSVSTRNDGSYGYLVHTDDGVYSTDKLNGGDLIIDKIVDSDDADAHLYTVETYAASNVFCFTLRSSDSESVELALPIDARESIVWEKE